LYIALGKQVKGIDSFILFVALNERLVEKDNSYKFSSYISTRWFEMYLKDRQPLPINYNPGLVFTEDEEIMKLPADKRQLVRTTNLLVSALR